MPRKGEMRNGRPRINWAIETAKLAWTKYKMYEDTNLRSHAISRGRERPFNYTYITHIRKVIQEARKGTF